MLVFFGNEEMNPNQLDCAAVYPLERFITGTDALIEATIAELFAGPTEIERAAGYTSWFSEDTRDAFIYAPLADGTLFVNLRDIRSELPGVSSSCGSAQFMSAIEHTALQFPEVEHVVYEIEGDSHIFYEWVQLGCDETNGFCGTEPFESAE